MKHTVFFLNTIIQYIIYVFLFHETLRKKYSFVAVCVGWFFVTALLYLGNICRVLPDQLYSFSKGVLLPAVVLALCYKGSVPKKLMLYALVWIVALVSEGVGYLVIWNAFSVQEQYMIVMLREEICVSSGRLLVSTVMLIMVVCIVAVMRFKEFRSERLLAPLMVILFYAIAHTVFLSIYFFVNANNITQTSNLIQLIFQALLETFIFIQYYSMMQIGRMLQREKKLAELQNEIADNKRYFELASSRFEEISALRSELKQQLDEVVSSISAPDGMERAGSIMNSISERLNSIRAVNYCDNHTLNAVLTVKLNEERFKGIPVTITLRDCSAAGLDSYEMCSIVSNMFDNAAESCLRLPDPTAASIDIKSGIRSGYFVIKMTNSCPEGQDVSSPKGEGHGYGLGIIREICRKNDGDLMVSREGGTVVSSAFLRVKE